jgi:hypothetical protein
MGELEPYRPSREARRSLRKEWGESNSEIIEMKLLDAYLKEFDLALLDRTYDAVMAMHMRRIERITSMMERTDNPLVHEVLQRFWDSPIHQPDDELAFATFSAAIAGRAAFIKALE